MIIRQLENGEIRVAAPIIIRLYSKSGKYLGPRYYGSIKDLIREYEDYVYQ